MDNLWHIVGIAMWWFVLSDTFYRHYALSMSFVAAVFTYPVILLVSQMIIPH